MDKDKALNKLVLPLVSTRVWRTYYGGKLIETWQNKPDAADGEQPEEWVASVVQASNPGREAQNGEGLCRVALDNGQTPYLKDLIETDPIGFLGEKHVKACGSSTGVLVKLIDSMSRLTIQVHPDKTFAKEVFDSDYGKAEAWYIIGGREINGETPSVLLGFAPHITRAAWEDAFVQQDIPAMISCLNRIYVKPGDVFMIEGGVPHAIGAGCFLVEVSEPTDYTLRTERKTPENKPIIDQLCHQGAGFNKLLDCFHYEGYTEEEVISRWSPKPRVIHAEENYSEQILIGEDTTALFGMNRVVIHPGKSCTPAENDGFSSVIVLSGKGLLKNGAQALGIKQGDKLFIPASADPLSWSSSCEEPLEIVRCFPPSFSRQ